MPKCKPQTNGLLLVTGPLTKTISMDCEFVGVGEDGRQNALARVSIVNYYGDVIYDEWVKPDEPVVDFRTWVSGVRPKNLKNAKRFSEAQAEVAQMKKGRILVGHSIKNDLKVLELAHPPSDIRDTARYKYLCPLGPISLKTLVKQHLNKEIQTGEHSPVEDSRGCLLLYRKFQKKWEADLKQMGPDEIYTPDGSNNYGPKMVFDSMGNKLYDRSASTIPTKSRKQAALERAFRTANTYVLGTSKRTTLYRHQPKRRETSWKTNYALYVR